MARQLPPLKALRAFEAAARLGSFSKAGNELNVTHAAISQQIRLLEDWIGARLFRRVTRGVELLESGERYRTFLTDVFDRLELQTAELRVQLGASRVTLRVDPQFAVIWLGPRLATFSETHPDIELSVVTEDGVFDPRGHDADLAIVYDYTDKPDHDGSLVCEPLIVVDARPVCSKTYAANLAASQPSDLLAANLLHDEDRKWWRQWFEAAEVALPDTLTGPLYSQSHVALLATEAGQGVALLDDLEVSEALLNGSLVCLFELGIPAGGYFLMSRPVDSLNSAVVITREWLLNEMATFMQQHHLVPM